MFAKSHKPTERTRAVEAENNAPLGASRKLNKPTLTNPIAAAGVGAASSAPEKNQDRAKLEAKLARSEERYAQQQAELHELKREKEDREVELRLSHAREAKLAASLEKSKSNTKLQHITATLQKLTTLHEASKSESNAAIREARLEAQRLREERDVALSKERELESRVGRLSAEVKAAKVALEGAKREKGELKDAARKAEEAEAALQRMLEQLKEEHAHSARRQAELQQAIQDAESVVESLEGAQEELVLVQGREKALVKAACELGQRLEVQREETRDAALKAGAAEVALQSLYAQIEAMKVQHAEALSAAEEKTAWQLAHAQSYDSHAPSLPVLDDAESPIPELSGLNDAHDVLLSDLEQRLHLAQLAHSNAEAYASSLASQLDATHAALLELQRQNASLSNVASRIPTLENELASLRETHEGAMTALNAEKLARAMGEAEVEKAKKEVENARVELKGAKEVARALGAKVGNARAKEDRWADECDDLANALSRASEFETLYNALTQEHALLLSRTAQAEAEATHYATLNATLASHTNADQKILYVDRVRRERDDAVASLLEVQVALQLSEREKREMKAKLECFEGVERPIHLRPSAKMTRVRRTEKLARTLPASAFAVADASVEQHARNEEERAEPLCSTPARKVQRSRTPLKVIARPLVSRGAAPAQRRRVSAGLMPPPIAAAAMSEEEWADEVELLTPGRAREGELTLADLTCA